MTDFYMRQRPHPDNMVIERKVEFGRYWILFGSGLRIEVPEKIFWLINLGDDWPPEQVAIWGSDARRRAEEA